MPPGRDVPQNDEQLPANDDDAVANSLALVDEADIYVGVFAYRYGHVPKGRTKSLTHLEYEHALKRGIPFLAFIIDDLHPVTGADVETGPSAEKLKLLKDQIRQRSYAPTFKSPEELKALVIGGLEAVKKKIPSP